MRIEPGGRLGGWLELPGDKSISHRYALLAAMAAGRSQIGNYSPSADCAAMLACVEALGVEVERNREIVDIISPGWRKWNDPSGPLDAANSGTALRLLAGPVSGSGLTCRLTGDSSLRSRPMSRIVTPLREMGAAMTASPGGLPPLDVQGARLHGITYAPPQASAQVKSCVLLAGLVADGETTVVEQRQTRDHTERALPIFGVRLEQAAERLTVRGPADLSPARVAVPGDLSAAAYLLAAALLLAGSRLSLNGVGCNPTRAGLLQLLEDSGAAIRREQESEENGEPRCHLVVETTAAGDQLQLPDRIPEALVPNLIDELPLLALLATQSSRGLHLRNAGELRHKETDRIHAVVVNLRSLGVAVDEFDDGFSLAGGQPIRGGRVTTFGDHRIAMTFAVAGLISTDGVELDDPGCVAVSHPNFFDDLESVRSSA